MSFFCHPFVKGRKRTCSRPNTVSEDSWQLCALDTRTMSTPDKPGANLGSPWVRRKARLKLSSFVWVQDEILQLHDFSGMPAEVSLIGRAAGWRLWETLGCQSKREAQDVQASWKSAHYIYRVERGEVKMKQQSNWYCQKEFCIRSHNAHHIIVNTFSILSLSKIFFTTGFWGTIS